MSRLIHVSLNIRGVLATWGSRSLEGLLANNETGELLTPHETRKALEALLASGCESLPIDDPPCEGFDYGGGGCPGHLVEDESA